MRMEASDEDLVAAALRGDAEAFSTLVARHYDTIYRFAYRMQGQRAEAEDLAQDVCATLPAKLGTWTGRARFTTWLYRIVANAAIDRYRRTRTRTKAAEGWGETTLFAQEEDRVRQYEIAWLHQAMARLPPDLRATVALVLGEDMTHAEAAVALDLSEGTISWRMSEVRRELRRLAEEEART
jgi:RNA polymerase sigma-70 factor (ECF subfamily)